jgi:hypothetical protein
VAVVERHHAYGYNVWLEGEDVKIDFFFFSDRDP